MKRTRNRKIQVELLDSLTWATPGEHREGHVQKRQSSIRQFCKGPNREAGQGLP